MSHFALKKKRRVLAPLEPCVDLKSPPSTPRILILKTRCVKQRDEPRSHHQFNHSGNIRQLNLEVCHRSSDEAKHVGVNMFAFLLWFSTCWTTNPDEYSVHRLQRSSDEKIYVHDLCPCFYDDFNLIKSLIIIYFIVFYHSGFYSRDGFMIPVDSRCVFIHLMHL